MKENRSPDMDAVLTHISHYLQEAVSYVTNGDAYMYKYDGWTLCPRDFYPRVVRFVDKSPYGALAHLDFATNVLTVVKVTFDQLSDADKHKVLTSRVCLMDVAGYGSKVYTLKAQ